MYHADVTIVPSSLTVALYRSLVYSSEPFRNCLIVLPENWLFHYDDWLRSIPICEWLGSGCWGGGGSIQPSAYSLHLRLKPYSLLRIRSTCPPNRAAGPFVTVREKKSHPPAHPWLASLRIVLERPAAGFLFIGCGPGSIALKP